MTLADLIRSHRVQLDMSLQDLANETSISKGHLHDLEKGRTVDIKVSTAMKLAAILGVSLTAVVHASVQSIGVPENTKTLAAKTHNMPFQFRDTNRRHL